MASHQQQAQEQALRVGGLVAAVAMLSVGTASLLRGYFFQRAASGSVSTTRNLSSTGISSSRSSSSSSSIYKLIYTVPTSHLATKHAVFAAGGGTYENGKYKNTTFESPGLGVFTPDKGANPNIGTVGAEERCEEVRVEVRCEGLEVTKQAVKALLLAHPYETVGYEVFRAEDELMAISKAQLLEQQRSSS